MSYNPKNPRILTPPENQLYSNYSTKLRVRLSFPEDSLHTKQEFKDECDVNVILRRYQQTGELPALNERAPQFLDVSAPMDFQTSMQYVAEANSLFNELPSHIRNRFLNDPAQFLAFCSDERNHLEMAKMGLLKPQNEWKDPNMYSDKKSVPDVKSELLSQSSNSQNSSEKNSAAPGEKTP